MIILIELVKKIIYSGLKNFFTGHWYIAIKNLKESTVADKMNKHVQITSPDDRFYADPFIYKKDNTNYIFFEDFKYDSNKGVISCIAIDKHGRYTRYPSVLEREYHLSYPFIFEWKNEIFMIPETSANKTIELYRAVKFPTRWVRESILMKNINAVDATLLEHNNTFWLFANISEDGSDYNSNLHLFYSDTPFGKWIPHPCNPIVSDKRRSRPAGSLFYENGNLMRPGQDCSICYGHAIYINKVEVLNKTSYKETPVRRIKPSLLNGTYCTHTINFNNDYEVIDGKKIRNKLTMVKK